ncbi:MAG: iron ABC transporter permease [Gammaproteobacteria bacterium]|nr:iron ABC transporter permease [Gammaproteobacteria bacterium]
MERVFSQPFRLSGQTGLALAGFCTLAAIFYALFHGTETIQTQSFFDAFWNHQPSLAHDILFQLRLPRILCAFVTGGLLALAGCLMQALLQNPLADPYILGVSGGASVGALICTVLGLSSFVIACGSWAGSLLTMVLVWILSGHQQHKKEYNMLLTGIAIASLSAAVVSIMLITSHHSTLRGMLFWMMGDLSDSSWPTMGFVVLIIGFICSFGLVNQLNVFVGGKEEAYALGIPVAKLQIQLYLLASLMTATAVTIGGCIGFIGLIIPHLLRMGATSQHRYLLPSAVLLGAALLIFADTFSQIILAPEQLPVGMIMTLIGVPIFLFLLRKNLHVV